MKKAFLLGLLILFAIGVQAQEILTNQSILDMKGLGFSDEVIVAKIKATSHRFDSSLNALSELKKQGVSESVILAMIESSNKSGQLQDDGKNSTSGIFYEENGKMHKILSTVFCDVIEKTFKTIAVIYNLHSVNVIHSSQPEFNFFFEKKNIDMAEVATNRWHTTATSPNDFYLVAFELKDKSREVVIESIGSNTIDKEKIIPFSIKTIDDYTFVVTPEVSLPIGEYAFVYKNITNYKKQSVFDFSIQQ